MKSLAKIDHQFVWHPFTQMRDWLKHDPIVIVSGRGAVLRDANDREYLDANSSIWTNLHGHHHPKINAAINRQLKRIAHSSALGLANEPASLLAEKLVHAANPATRHPQLNKVFFSDDGSTALEVALKLAYEFTRRTRGNRSRPRFLSLAGAYHGDTVGAVSLGHIGLFHRAYARRPLEERESHEWSWGSVVPFSDSLTLGAEGRVGRRNEWQGSCGASCEEANRILGAGERANEQRRERYD